MEAQLKLSLRALSPKPVGPMAGKTLHGVLLS